MIALSSSGVCPVISSTSTRRARKISAALGSILSEMRTFGMMMCPCFRRHPRESGGPAPVGCAGGTVERWVPAFAGMTSGGRKLRPGPGEPGAERFDIGGFDGRAAPDTQDRRGLAIAGHILGLPFGAKRPDERRVGYEIGGQWS